MSETTRVTIELDKNLWLQVKQLALVEDKRVSTIVDELLRSGLETRRKL